MTGTTVEAICVEDGRDAPLSLDHSPLNCYVREINFCLIYATVFSGLYGIIYHPNEHTNYY